MHIVITGSSKGIGKALARKFLELGDTVIICSRSQEAVDATVKEFKAAFNPERADRRRPGAHDRRLHPISERTS